jgi:hypothetical protein
MTLGLGVQFGIHLFGFVRRCRPTASAAAATETKTKAKAGGAVLPQTA